MEVQHRSVLLFVLVTLLFSSIPTRIYALDFQVSTNTSTQIYEVRGGQPNLFLTRRRVTERLSLRLDRILPSESESGYQGPRISASFMIRLDTDFGHRGRETNLYSDLFFVPGYDPYALDIMMGEILVRDLFAQTTSIRAGRLISLDPTGFSAVDGLELRVHLPWKLELWIRTGAEVVSGQRLSSGNFEIDGVLRARRDDILDGEHTEFEDPPTRVVLAAGASMVDFDWMTADLAFRQGMIPGDESRTSYQTLAGAISVSAGPVDGAIVVAGDFALMRFSELSAEVFVRPLSWFKMGLAGRYDAPIFDIDSIFAAFWSDPSVDGELSFEFRPWHGLRLGGMGIIRQVGFLSDDDETSALRYGGEVYSRVRFRFVAAELRGRFGYGYGGQRVGAIARCIAGVPRTDLSFDFRGILFSEEKDLPGSPKLFSIGYVIGSRYQMSREAALLLEFEHNYNEEIGQQFRFLALLDLGVWI